MKEKLALYGLTAAEDAWDETIPGLGRVRLQNLVTVVPGSTDDAILVLAHRDDTGVGPGANDNASGTAALIELARGYGRLGTVAGRPKPQHTLVFLSSDGGAYGGFGAERFASTSPLRDRIKAVVSLDGLAGTARPRLELAGLRAALARSGADPDRRRPGRGPARPAAGAAGLARPARRPRRAVRLRRAGAVPRPQDLGDPARDGARQRRGGRRPTRPARLDPTRFLRLGRAAESILASLDGGIELAGGTAGHVYLGSRIIRGWAIELVLLDGARSRSSSARSTSSRAAGGGGCRCRVPGGRSGRGSASGSGSGSLVGLGALAGVFPRGSAIPPPPDSPAVTDWPVAGLAVLGAARGARLVARPPGARRRSLPPATTRCSPGTPSRSSRSAASRSRPR